MAFDHGKGSGYERLFSNIAVCRETSKCFIFVTSKCYEAVCKDQEVDCKIIKLCGKY